MTITYEESRIPPRCRRPRIFEKTVTLSDDESGNCIEFHLDTFHTVATFFDPETAEPVTIPAYKIRRITRD